MLYMFNKAKARYGIRAVYQSCLLLFAVSILSFFFGSRFMLGDGNLTAKMIIGIVGGLCGSWSIGAFFMMPYLAPSQISGVEEKLTGKNHSAMYFAGNAVTTSIVGAISGNLVYEYVKNVFIAKGHGLVWAEAAGDLSAPEVAYSHFFGQVGTEAEVAASVFNFGNLMVPFIVLITCVLGYFLAFKLPRDFKSVVLARELKEMDPSLDISAFEEAEEKQERSEIIFVQIGLSILSGFLFGFIWVGMLFRNIKNYRKFPAVWGFLLSCFVPFVQIVYLLRARKEILAVAAEKGVEVKLSVWALVLPSLVFPVLFTNVIALSVLQNGLNRIYAFEDQ